MTLPNYVKLSHLDPGIRNLVININRIPEVYTQTTCEGHVWTDVPAWPTKNGWIHFNKPETKHDELVNLIENYCQTNPIFTLVNFTPKNQNIINNYTISGLFESHEGYTGLKPFQNMTEKEQIRYWNRAYIRKEKLLLGWKEINNLVLKYISEELRINPKNLPYRNINDPTDFRIFRH